MKKFVALLMVLSMLFNFSTFTFAEEISSESSADVTISYNAEDVKLAKEFEITVSINNNSDATYYGAGFTLKYGNNLEYVSLNVVTPDDCMWETEVYPKDSDGDNIKDNLYMSTFSDLSGNILGVESGKSLDFIFTFKAINTGDVQLSVEDALCVNDSFSDIYFENATDKLSISYPAKTIGISLLVGTGININFYSYVPSEYAGAKMHFTQELVNDGVYSENESKLVDGKDSGRKGVYNGVSTPIYDYILGVNPDRINDMIHAYLVYDGIAISAPASSSVMMYCNHVFQNGQKTLPESTAEQYEAFEALICDLVNYCIETQKYTGYNASSPIRDAIYKDYNFSPSEFQKPTVSDFNVVKTEITDPVLSGVTLSLGSKFRLRYTVNATSTKGIKFKVTETSEKGTRTGYISGDKLIPSGESGKYFINMVPAAVGVDYVYNLTAYDANGNASTSVTFSVKSYVAAYQDDAEVGDLAKALYTYGKSLSKYASIM